MNWPFVSRARFEDLQRRLVESEAERKEVWERLLDLTEQSATAPRALSPTVEADHGGQTASFTTPFDRIGRNFDAANKGKPIDIRFKARAR